MRRMPNLTSVFTSPLTQTLRPEPRKAQRDSRSGEQGGAERLESGRYTLTAV